MNINLTVLTKLPTSLMIRAAKVGLMLSASDEPPVVGRAKKSAATRYHQPCGYLP